MNTVPYQNLISRLQTSSAPVKPEAKIEQIVTDKLLVSLSSDSEVEVDEDGVMLASSRQMKKMEAKVRFYEEEMKNPSLEKNDKLDQGPKSGEKAQKSNNSNQKEGAT